MNPQISSCQFLWGLVEMGVNVAFEISAVRIA